KSLMRVLKKFFFFFQAEDGIRDFHVTGVQTCALPMHASDAPFPGSTETGLPEQCATGVAREWPGPGRPGGSSPQGTPVLLEGARRKAWYGCDSGLRRQFAQILLQLRCDDIVVE